MDKSLDDIIKSKPKGIRRTGRRGARAAILGTSGTAAGPAARARYAGAAPTNGVAQVPVVQASDKIIVSNLPYDVNEIQIKELFSSTVGPLKDVTLHYDAAGKSKGIATVQFSKKGDGSRAHAQYNNRLIDGKRPMKIEMVLGPLPPPSLVNRVAPPVATMEGVQTTAARAARGRKVGRGRGRRNKSDRAPKTAEELDTEMEDYTKAETAGAAPVAV